MDNQNRGRVSEVVKKAYDTSAQGRINFPDEPQSHTGGNSDAINVQVFEKSSIEQNSRPKPATQRQGSFEIPVTVDGKKPMRKV
ncbi:hypothetical protein AAVH_06579 [Aphelenchoides avenae]|nr:hypothetical protein AAVH_06579 [Aphelenchus avenae]